MTVSRNLRLIKPFLWGLDKLNLQLLIKSKLKIFKAKNNFNSKKQVKILTKVHLIKKKIKNKNLMFQCKSAPCRRQSFFYKKR